jgi:hypothetical protein
MIEIHHGEDMSTSLFCCKFTAAVAFSIALAGCSLTPDQERGMHEVAMQSMRSNSESLQMQQQQIQHQRQMRQSRSVNCTHRAVGGTVYTNCQ